LLDLMLPKIDWITLCKRFRQTSQIPIIMMTAKWADDDKILGLESGADDYIVKPFKIEELYLRILNLSKRLNIKKIEKIWNFEINFSDKIIKKDSKIVELKLKEFQIFEFIFHKETVSRTQILEEIWWEEDLFSDDNKLDVNIYSLRKKLDKNLIKTIKWFWYSINKNYDSKN
jgi:DNA-binding response OmpR family regulator